MAKKINDNSEYNPTLDILEQAKDINQQTHDYIDWNQKTSHMLSDKSFEDKETIENDWADFGNSTHDKTSFNPTYKTGDLNEMRAEDQGFWEKVGLGGAKMTTTAATTFLDNTVGFLWGIGSAFKNGDASKIFDNDFTNAMADFNEWCEEQMPHYSSKYEGWGIDFWGNFIGKDLLQNAGFQIGTGLSLLVPGAAMKVPGNAFKATKMFSNFMKTGKAINTGNAAKDLVLSTYAAIGEAGIEGLNNKRDFVKYQQQAANDEFNNKQAQLDMQWQQLVATKYNGDEEAAKRTQDFNDYFYQKQDLQRQKSDREKFIQKEADKVADMTFLANLALVGGTNFSTFGKSLTGYNLNKRFGNVVTDIVDSEGKVLSKNVRNKTAKDVIKSGKYQVKNENYGKWVRNKETGKLEQDTRKYIEKEAKVQTRAKEKSIGFNIAKDIFGEGIEEMNQEVASQYSAGIAETEMLQYEALANNDMAYDDILKQMNDTWFSYGEMAKALGKVYTDPAQYRQFFGGAFGTFLSPHFTKKPGGGLQFHLNNLGAQSAAIREQNSTNAYIAEQINKNLNSEESKNYLTGLLRHTALERVKYDAVAADSRMDYENADFAQFVSDITMMSNAGKLDLLQARLEGMKNMSDEEMEKVCMQLASIKDKNGKSEVVGDFVDQNGNYLGNSESDRFKIRKKINERVERLQKDISLYQKAMNDIDGATGGKLDHETLAAFTWEKAQLMNKYGRAKSILGGSKAAKAIGIYKDAVSANLLKLNKKREVAETSLKAEKEKLSKQKTPDEKSVQPSELQKNLEKQIEDYTKQISRATQLSDLLVAMEQLQVLNFDYDEDKKAIESLFEKYKSFKETLPDIFDLFKVYNDDGTLADESKQIKDFSLEGLMGSGWWSTLMDKVSGTDAAESMTADFEDVAKLYHHAQLAEKSLDNLIQDPSQFTEQRAALEERITEFKNGDLIKEIESNIEKGIDAGDINLKNITEKADEIAKAVTEERRKGIMGKISSMMDVTSTPLEKLRQIAINNIFKKKKYSDLKNLRDFINGVYLRIAVNQNASDDAKKIATETFNKLINGKKRVDDIVNTTTDLKEFDVNSLLVQESPERKQAKLDAYKSNPNSVGYNLNTYQFTEESVSNASIVQNEAKNLLDSVIKDTYDKLNNHKESINLNNKQQTNEPVEIKEQRDKLEKRKESVIKGVQKLIENFKGSTDILSNEELAELIDKASSIVEKQFNPEDFDESLRNDILNIRNEYDTTVYNLVTDYAKQRVNDYYNKNLTGNDLETANAISNAFDTINKALSKIKKKLEKISGNEVFADEFESIANEDGSIELAHSVDGYYFKDNKVYRGHLVKCNYTYGNCFAFVEQINETEYHYNVVDEHGAIIAVIRTSELIEPTKRGGAITLDATKTILHTPNATSLQLFKNLPVLQQPATTTQQENRQHKEKREAVKEVLQQNGTLTEDGKVDLKQNVVSSIIQSNVIMDDTLTGTKSEIKTVIDSSTTQSTGAQRKRSISQLDEQITELDNMLERLQDAAKQNPQYHDTVRIVTTFKQYVEFVRNNYKALGEPKNVVLDENQVFSMMDSFRQQLGKIFGNDVQFLSDEEIEQAAKDANNDSQFQIGKKASTEFDDVNSKREFKQSLFRGQSSKPKINDDGNLVLHPTYDELSKNTGISFANNLTAAEQYGHRYSHSPYIIELDVEYINTKYPLKENTSKGGRFIGDEYGDDAWEERLSDDNDIIIPKNYYKIHHKRLDLSMYTNNQLLRIKENLEEELNVQDEMVFSAFGSKASSADIKAIEDELEYRDTHTTIISPLREEKIDVYYKDGDFTFEYIPYYSKNGETFYDGVQIIDKNGKYNFEVSEEDAEDFKKGKPLIYRDYIPAEYKYDYKIDESRIKQGPFNMYLGPMEIERIYGDTPFSKSNGEIYGFTNEGKVILNKDKFRLDTPVHEYTHLWDKACMKHSHELWKRGVELMKQHPEWQKVIEDQNYANIKDNEDLVASEVHSRLSGMLAAGKAISFAGNKRIKKGFWAKLIEWFKQFKDFTLRHVFGMSKEDAQKVTLEQFLSAPVADFMLGTDPRDVSNINYTIASKPKKQAKPVDTSLKVGDTVQYSGIAKKAIVKSITSKGITIETEDGRQYKDVAPRHLQYLYGQKPSANAKFDDLDDAVTPEEFIAKKLVGVKINDTKNDITNLDNKLVSKKGKTIDELVLAIKDEIPFSISDYEIKDHIIDIASGRSINDIKQYAIDAHYAAQDAEYQAQVSAINERIEKEPNTLSYGQTEGQSDDEDWDMSLLDSPYEDEAIRNVIDGMIADELSEEAYQEYLEQRANEEGVLTDEQWFEIFGEGPQENPIVEQIKTKTEELKGNIPPSALQIINDDTDGKLASDIDNAAKREKQGEPRDTWKPAISEFNINDKSTKFVDDSNRDAYGYIYDLYDATGAFEYVKHGNLRANDKVYIAYGKVGENDKGKSFYNVVFLVDDNKGGYQMIGTLSSTANSDPITAESFRREVDTLVKNRNNYKIAEIRTIKRTDSFGDANSKISFKLLLNDGNPVTTTISKVLNGSMVFSDKRHSLKDLKLSTGKTVGATIADNEEHNLAIAFYDGDLELQGTENFTVNSTQLEAMKAFKNKGSNVRGHIVLAIDKPDGRKQLIPLRVSTFGELLSKPNNQIVKNIKNVISGLYDVYTSNQSLKDKNDEIFQKKIMLEQYLHDISQAGIEIFIKGKNAIKIECGNNGRILSNEDGSRISKEQFENELLNQLSNFIININENTLTNNNILNFYLNNDVFNTYLTETDFRNAHFTINPITSSGVKIEVKKEVPENKILRNSGIKNIIATVGKQGLYNIVVVEDLKGKYEIYQQIGSTFTKGDVVKSYSTVQQFAMVAYAKLKKGIETPTYDIIQNGYIKNGDNFEGPVELLVHKTELGENYVYDTKSFKRIDYAITIDGNGKKYDIVNQKDYDETTGDVDYSLDSTEVQKTIDKDPKKQKENNKESNSLPELLSDKKFAEVLMTLPQSKAITQFFNVVSDDILNDAIKDNDVFDDPNLGKLFSYLSNNIGTEQLRQMSKLRGKYENNIFEVYCNFLKSNISNLQTPLEEALGSPALKNLIQNLKKQDTLTESFKKDDNSCKI